MYTYIIWLTLQIESLVFMAFVTPDNRSGADAIPTGGGGGNASMQCYTGVMRNTVHKGASN